MNEPLILQLYKDQRHSAVPGDYTNKSITTNPSCGDEITLFATIKNGTIHKIWFTGAACSVTFASAEYICRQLEGTSVDELKTFTQEKLLSGLGMDITEKRLSCALLPYSALEGLVTSR